MVQSIAKPLIRLSTAQRKTFFSTEKGVAQLCLTVMLTK